MAGLQMLCLFVFIWLSMIKGKRAAVEVRLVDGKTPHDGRVEVRTKYGAWKSICDYGTWNLRKAYVVCRMLNYAKAVSAGSTKVQGYHRFTNSMPLCDGGETSIDQCHQYYHSCQYYGIKFKYAATVGCESLTAEEKAIKVRLVGTKVSHFGQVEIQYNGTWGAVCYLHWDIKDAHVICRMLGYKAAAEEMFYSIDQGESRTKLVMDEVRCTGNETSIAGCYHKGWFNVKTCNLQVLAGVVCQVNGVSQPVITVSEGLPCTAELTINSTINTDIEKKLIQFYDIQLINKHSNSSSSLLVAGSASNVTIGDGKYYNGIYNKPLEPGSTYYIRVRAVTRTHDRGYAYGDTNLIVFTTSLCTNTKDQIQTSLLLIIICGSLSLFC